MKNKVHPGIVDKTRSTDALFAPKNRKERRYAEVVKRRIVKTKAKKVGA